MKKINESAKSNRTNQEVSQSPKTEAVPPLDGMFVLIQYCLNSAGPKGMLEGDLRSLAAHPPEFDQAMRDMVAKGDVRRWPDGKVTLEKCLRAPAADEFNQALFDLDDTAEKCGAMLVMLADQLCEHIEEFEPGIPHNRAGGFVLLALDLREELTARHSALFAISRRLGKLAKN